MCREARQDPHKAKTIVAERQHNQLTCVDIIVKRTQTNGVAARDRVATCVGREQGSEALHAAPAYGSQRVAEERPQARYAVHSKVLAAGWDTLAGGLHPRQQLHDAACACPAYELPQRSVLEQQEADARAPCPPSCA